MYRYALEVMYNGVCFHGSQVQGELATVQRALDEALTVLLKQPMVTYGASRTDEGVHALCNFYHFDVETPIDFDLLYKLNAITSAGLSAKRLVAIAPDANVRFDAISRRYRYVLYRPKNPFRVERGLFYPYTIYPECLHATAAIIAGHTHFETFCKRNSQAYTYKCQITASYWEQTPEGEWHYVVEGNRFLRGMVRGLVATQLYIAKNKLPPAHLHAIFEAKDSKKARFDVPGYGLYLEHIAYPQGYMQDVNTLQ